jgi:hypothetical protein
MKLYDFLKGIQRAKNNLSLSREEVARAGMYYEQVKHDKKQAVKVLSAAAIVFTVGGRI